MAAGGSSLTPIVMIGGILVGGYFFVTGCVGNKEDGTKKDCYGLFKPGNNNGQTCTINSDCGAAPCQCVGGQCTGCPDPVDLCAGKTCANGCDPATGNCIPTGGCNKTCGNGYKLNKSTCSCDCNRCIKSCGTNQVAVVSGGQCSCRDCPAGYHRSPTGTCNSNTAYSCVKDAGPPPPPPNPCANKTCPTGFTKVQQGSVCNCLCQVNCGGCTSKVATSTMCKCVQNQGSSGNCGWDGNQYHWCSTGCDNKRHCNTYTGGCSKDAANRTSGCANAKKSFCNTWSVVPSKCISGSGNACCAPQGVGGASGYSCATDGICNWEARVNFGGLKVWNGPCKGSFSGCCSYAISQLKKKYNLGSGYQVPPYYPPQQLRTIPDEIPISIRTW